MKEQSLSEILYDAMGYGNYRGTLIRQLIGGWEWKGTKYLTKQSLDDAINLSLVHLEHSVVRGENIVH